MRHNLRCLASARYETVWQVIRQQRVDINLAASNGSGSLYEILGSRSLENVALYTNRKRLF